MGLEYNGLGRSPDSHHGSVFWAAPTNVTKSRSSQTQLWESVLGAYLNRQKPMIMNLQFALRPSSSRQALTTYLSLFQLVCISFIEPTQLIHREEMDQGRYSLRKRPGGAEPQVPRSKKGRGGDLKTMDKVTLKLVALLASLRLTLKTRCQ